MLSELIELSQGSRDATAFEAGALELLQREVGFDVAYLTVRGNEAEPTAMGLERSLVERVVAHAESYLEELLPVKQAAFGSRGVAVDTEVLGFGRVRETRYFRELVKPAGGRHSLMAYVPWKGEPLAAIMLGRAGGTFSASEVSRIEAALPALGVGRAAFGLRWASRPLRAETPPLLARLGLREAKPRASVPMSKGSLVVRDRNGHREMVATDGPAELIWTRAALEDPSVSAWPYVDLFHVAAALAKHRRRALFVGCGGGVAMRQFARAYPGIAMDVVESEPAVIELARSHYDLAAIPGLTVHVADGVQFIEQARPATWDIVVVDAFDVAQVSAFTTASFFGSVRRALRAGGAMAFNLISSLDGTGPLAAFVKAAGRHLNAVRIVPVMGTNEAYDPHASRNIVVVGQAP